MPPRWQGGIERYRRIIYLQERTVTADDVAGQVVTWTTVAKRRAQVKMLYGQQNYLSNTDQEVAMKRYQVRIRRASDVTPRPADMRLRLDDATEGRTLDIESASEDERMHDWLIVAKETDQ